MPERLTSIGVRDCLVVPGLIAAAMVCAAAHAGDGDQWINLTDETATRLIAASSIGAFDIEEKDYAWGDIDQDGDIDLVCVRKEPFTSPGGRRNVLFMNEGLADGHAIDGVLVDRTEMFIADVDGVDGNDFLDPTNDRDVVLVDVDNDGWLDIVTATTLADGQPKTISHPRIYMNLGESDGIWLGFAYDEPRIPEIITTAAPRFCSVAAGDLTGDGFADLYFGDYDSGGAQIVDYNNRLLINDGAGFFTDETETRLTMEMRESAFGAASVIADMNGDGVLDVVKQTALNPPQHVAITYNNPGEPGDFIAYDIEYSLAPYFVSVDDLNGDGMLDIVVTDDGVDRYMLNQGNDGSGFAQFVSFEFPEGDGEFGGNSVIADLDRDCFNDVIIADVDVDITGCNRPTHIYRNAANPPDVTFSDESAVIPDSLRTGVHDVAVFDLNNDGWLDLIVGRCTGMQVWMQTPQAPVRFGYPAGRPLLVEQGQSTAIPVELKAICGEQIDPASAMLHFSIDGGEFTSTPLTAISGDQYEAQLPALSCGSTVEYFLEAAVVGGSEPIRDPAAAPAATYSLEATDLEETFRDELEGPVDAWTVTNDETLTSGAWEAAEPIGTISGAQLAAPSEDHTPDPGVVAFITENGVPGGSLGAADIDGGATALTTPPLDLSAFDDAEISWARWFFTTEPGVDFLRTEISDDGGATWTLIDEVTETIGDAETGWQVQSIRVSEYAAATTQVHVRFTAGDIGNGSIVEAGIDDLIVFGLGCTPCPQDIAPAGSPDGVVDINDLLAVLAAWGDCPAPCPQDTNGDEQVDINDLLNILAAWGPCSE